MTEQAISPLRRRMIEDMAIVAEHIAKAYPDETVRVHEIIDGRAA
jgi:hypothetical protein